MRKILPDVLFAFAMIGAFVSVPMVLFTTCMAKGPQPRRVYPLNLLDNLTLETFLISLAIGLPLSAACVCTAVLLQKKKK